MDASTHDTTVDLTGGTLDSPEFERELRVRLAEAENTAARAEAEGEHDLADAMRSHADDLRRTAVLHALPSQVGDTAPLGATA